MSRAAFAEAVLKNILYYFDKTKDSRVGDVIASRNFIMSVAAHPHGFVKMGFSLSNSRGKCILHFCSSNCDLIHYILVIRCGLFITVVGNMRIHYMYLFFSRFL